MGLDGSFTIADIPGLIEGAADGHGLGHQFLRHVQRTKTLLHFLSLGPDESLDVVERYQNIRENWKSMIRNWHKNQKSSF